jgi:hypothetical protein
VRVSRFFASATVVLLVATQARAVRAGDPDPFDQHVAEAQTRYQAHDYEGAIASLEAAYRRKPVARLLFNLGMAHRKVGHLKEALDCFERFRAARSAVDQDVPVERYIDDVSREIAQGRSAADPPPLAEGLSQPPSPSGGASPPLPTAAVVVPSVSTTMLPLRAPTPTPTTTPARRAWPWIALSIGVAAGAGAAIWLATARGGGGPSATLPDIGPGAGSSLPLLVRW